LRDGLRDIGAGSFAPRHRRQLRLVLPDHSTMETSMSLSDLASLGSFVSGFAVLISLIYLALQVSQTKRNQQIAIRHSRASRIVDLQLALADPGVADAWLHGSGSPQQITQTEVSQFINLCRALFFHFEDSFYQREEGLLNDDAFETVVAGVRLSARSPGWRAAWRIARPNFAGRFRDFMDGVVAGSAVELPVDLSVEAWKAAFASEASRTS
jgi:hypothetical protein